MVSGGLTKVIERVKIFKSGVYGASFTVFSAFSDCREEGVWVGLRGEVNNL